jgi:aminopeptidase N
MIQWLRGLFREANMVLSKKASYLIVVSSLTFHESLVSENLDSSSIGEFNRIEIDHFLNVVAMAESDQWEQVVHELNLNFPLLMNESSPRKVLNRLKVKIFESDDLDLIKLYNRAVRNHDTLSKEKAEPVTSYYKHYLPPSFLIPNIHLTFDITDAQVAVTSDLIVKRNCEESSLILDGREHKVCEVLINGEAVPKNQYKVTPHELIILNIPEDDTFQVTIKSFIHPFANESLEGMYQCGQCLTTQCESEGARRIFFTLDRPDVLSCVTTTIIADKERYPYRLSNGNLVSEYVQEDGRSVIIWHDPYPKPSYLFACILGRFSQLIRYFTTRSGKEVQLQIYVEPGKESRAQYALFALKKAMEFDEKFFDREYDLSCLKMVGIPNFNSGAMENKGLMVFNDIRLLVDDQSGTDKTHRDVAHVVGHEYFHNWSGNRVTVRNWFEIALKEAFTDLRAMLFSEWLFGAEFIRPKAVKALRDNQFPEETSEEGHPIMVQSYVDAHSIYDQTTYTKGREVFRSLQNYIDMFIPNGFKEVQNLYFSRYDGQAVTFRELLGTADEVLKRVDKDLSLFERWFYQPGTPVVQANMKYDEDANMVEITFTQSCPHPKTGKKQEPFQIPFSLELLAKDGTIVCPKFSCVLENDITTFKIPSFVKPTPIFMHGYSAPVILHYDYTLEDLACIVKYTRDAFSRWEAAQNYFIMALKEMMVRIEKEPALELKAQKGELMFADLHQLYVQALKSDRLSPLAKAQITEAPSIRALSQAFHYYDFERLSQLRSLFIKQLALLCKPSLEMILEEYPPFANYEPSPEQMQIRELRNATLGLLVLVDPNYKEKVLAQYLSATNFDDVVSTFNLCLTMDSPYKEIVIADFYDKWKEDKAVFNFWLSSQASAQECRVEDLRRLESVKGYDPKNPNHVRSICRVFTSNLKCYHHPSGEGYQYIVDQILEIAKFNPLLAHNYITIPAFLDFEKLSVYQQTLMEKELRRLQTDEVPPQTRDLVERILERYYANQKSGDF